jgi:hypothetical protein
MKPGYGAHPAPFFLNPSIGAFDNWSYANKSHFKVAWWSKTDQKWRVRFYQHGAGKSLETKNYFMGSDEGCLSSYALGVALYAHFVRSWWPSAPAFLPRWGIADMLRVDVDMFRGQIDVKIVTGPLATLTEPLLSLEGARWELKNAGFELVDKKIDQYMDFHWLTDPKYFKSGAVPEAWRVTGIKARKKCDYCALLGLLGSKWQCEQHQNTNRCINCIKRGIPCSWTKAPKLYGLDWELGVDKLSLKSSEPGLKRVRELLWRKDPIPETEVVNVIPDPGYRKFTGI